MNTILQRLEEGTLIRNAWTGTDDRGRKTACLLAALSPEVEREKTAAACPAEIMPSWLAHLTPWMDDAGTLEAWPGMVRRYADLASRWHVLSDADWKRVEFTTLRIIVESVAPFAGQALPAVEEVLTLLRRAERGDVAPQLDWTKAAEAAATWATWEATRAAWAEAAWAASADTITAAILDAINAAILAKETA